MTTFINLHLNLARFFFAAGAIGDMLRFRILTSYALT
jgi:hypothetical protein